MLYASLLTVIGLKFDMVGKKMNILQRLEVHLHIFIPGFCFDVPLDELGEFVFQFPGRLALAKQNICGQKIGMPASHPLLAFY